MIARKVAPALPAIDPTPVSLKQEFGLWMPLVLFLAGWATFCFRNDSLFEFGATVGSLVALRMVYLLVLKCREIRFSWMGSCGLLLGYSLGTLNTALQLHKSGQTIAVHFGSAQDDLSFALALILWVSCTLLLVGAILERPILLDRSKLVPSDVSFVWLSLTAYFLSLATGQLGYMGATVSDDRHVTVLASVAGLVAPVLPAMTILLQDQSRILRRPLTLWIVLLIEVAMLIPMGRRMILYTVLTAVLSFTLRGSRWNSPLWKKAALLTAGLVGMYSANLLFYAMRYSAELEGVAPQMGARGISLTDLVGRSVEFIVNGRNSSFDADMAANLQDRTFVLPYFANLVVQSQIHEPLHGDLLLFDLKMATPTLLYGLYGDKSIVLAIGMEEVLANPRFGMYPTDEANSILTAGVSDFGIVGVFLYPILLCLILNFSIRVLMSSSKELIKFVVLFGFADCLFQTEMGLSGYIVGYRNFALAVVCWVPIDAALSFFSRSRSRRSSSLQSSRLIPGAVLVRHGAVSQAQ